MWLHVFIVSFLVYIVTAQRGVSWQDSGQFQWRLLTSDYWGDHGLALAHPLYLAGAQLFAKLPFAQPVALMNSFSGLGMAIALANIAVLLLTMTGKRWIALAGAAMLGVCHATWWLATIAEVYTWSVAGLTAELLLLVALIRRPVVPTLCGLAIVSGLGLSIHDLALLPVPAYLALVVWLTATRRLPAWAPILAAACYAVGASTFLAMVGHMAAQKGLAFALRSALFGGYEAQVLNTAATWALRKENAAIGALSFANALLPFAVVGWRSYGSRLGTPTAVALGTVTATQAVFVARYSVPDQFTFLLPTLAMLTIAAGIGMDVLAKQSRSWRHLVMAAVLLSIIGPPVLYGSLPSLARRLGITVERERVLPWRDELRYWVVPWKHNEDSAERFASQALRQASPDGIIVADNTSSPPLRIVRSLCDSTDVTIQSGDRPLPISSGNIGLVRSAAAGRTIWVVSPVRGNCPQLLLDNATFNRPPGGALYSLSWRNQR